MHVQLIEQGLQMRGEFSPARDRRFVDRLTHLTVAPRSDGAICFMESQAIFIPIKTAKFQRPFGLGFLVGNQRLVLDI